MAFTYTSAIQNQLSYMVFNVGYSSLTAAQKAAIDNTASPSIVWDGTNLGGIAGQAAVEVGQLAQWFEQAATTPNYSFPSPAWDRMFLAKASMIAVKSWRPDRYSEYQRDHETALDESIDTFTATTIAGALAGQSITTAGIRAHVCRLCAKRTNASTGLRRRLFPNIEDIDSHLQWTLNYLWNKELWSFRKRQVQLRTTIVTISTATWTESTRTLTQALAFTNANIGAGTMVLITGGTDVISGLYTVSSKTTSSAVVLDASISATAGNLSTGDIAGTMQVLTFVGIKAGETFDATATKKFYYDSADFGTTIEWADDEQCAALKAYWGNTVGKPTNFNVKQSGGVTSWHFMPNPDVDRTVRGAVYVSGIGTLADATAADAAIARFPPEFGPIIRDMVLARTLLQFGASDGESMWRRCEASASVLSQFIDIGVSNRDAGIGDVYGDIDQMVGYYNRGLMRGY